MTYQSRNLLAAASPLRSMQWGRPAELVLGYSDAQKAAWELDRARVTLSLLESHFDAARKALGNANKVRGPMRRFWQAKAMRSLNADRKALREGRARLVAAELAMAALATARA